MSEVNHPAGQAGQDLLGAFGVWSLGLGARLRFLAEHFLEEVVEGSLVQYIPNPRPKLQALDAGVSTFKAFARGVQRPQGPSPSS